MKYACQEKLIPGRTDDERAARARELGFDGIEINARAEAPLKERAASLSSALARHGCAAAGVCGGYRGWLGHFDAAARATAVSDIIALLPVAADIGAAGIVVPAAYGMFSRKLPPFQPPRSEAEDRSVLLESLRAVGEEAERRGVCVFLEPLNRYEDHMLNSLGQACDLVSALGIASVRPMIDLFHAGIEERDVAEAIRSASPRLGYVHLADSNRLEPGQGHLGYQPILEALTATGYSGWCSFECSLSVAEPTALARSLAMLRRVEGAGLEQR
jgi:sugar phosphate isomerase/epimerase